MKIAAWNVNHRADTTVFYPDAAPAIGSLPVDAIVLTEYYARNRHQRFAADLSGRGFTHQTLSPETREKANRVFIVAKQPFELDSLPLPSFDQQLPANVLAVRFPESGMRLLGVRIPYYTDKDLPRVIDAWTWLEKTAETLHGDRSIIIGDLNVALKSPTQRGGDHFRRILDQGWMRAQPVGSASYYGKGGVRTEIDHALCSPAMRFMSAKYAIENDGALFAGEGGALSDHAVLIVDVVGR